jgi:hypothetical protein
MNSLTSLAAVVVVSVIGLVACGGKSPPPASSAPSGSDSAAPADSSAPASSASSGSAAPASSGGDSNAPVSVDSQRDQFMSGCMKKMPAPDYCECGFQQFRDVFKGVDMNSVTSTDDPRFQQLQQQTMSQCASKMPEDAVKAGFMNDCSGNEPKKSPYCQCAWPALRKNLSVVDLISHTEGPRLDDARKAMVKVCKGKYPTEIAHTEFVAACSKPDPSTKTRCECVWKKVHAKYSTEEIVAGLADPHATPGLDTCK